MFRRIITFLFPVAAAVSLSQCAAPISVHGVEPRRPDAAGQEMRADIPTRLQHIRDHHDRIARGDDAAIPAYNFHVARLIESLQREEHDPWGKRLDFSTPDTPLTLAAKCPPGCELPASELVATDTLRFEGRYTEGSSSIDGIGASIILVAPDVRDIGRNTFRSHLPVRDLTAIVRFRGSEASLELIDPYQSTTVALQSRQSLPLASNQGAAAKLGLARSRVDKLGLARMLRPSRYDATAHLNFLQPYDAKRIPVLFVHGLQDTPVSFCPMYFALLRDPEIRAKYQFWTFSYPTGYSYPYSASLLRRELDAVRREFPDHRKIVMVGHSMGGLISRLMVTEPGDALWRGTFGKPVEETQLLGISRKILTEVLVFPARSEIDRVIFIASPHRGSELAGNWIGNIASRLIKLPHTVADIRNAFISVATIDAAGYHIDRQPNSIDSLSPRNPFVKKVNELPIVPGVPYHSIVGDRGRGNTPDSSDGVVAYWSSHLKGADCETIVPSGHSAHQHPEAIEKTREILLDHAKAR